MSYLTRSIIMFVAIASHAHAAPILGDLLDNQLIQGPEGCKNSNDPDLFSTHRGAPKEGSGQPEFNIYRLFACPNTRTLKRLVLWRIRHIPGAEQLVGEVALPRAALKKVRVITSKSGDPPYLDIGSGYCIIGTESNYEMVNALVPSTYEADEEVPRARVIFAWRVNGSNMTLEPLPVNHARIRCYAG